jgi:hypothetical protein
MKNITTISIFLICFISASQSFSNGYKAGYRQGANYLNTSSYVLPILTPLAPLPTLGRTTFIDGYNDGFVKANRTTRPVTRTVYYSEVEYKSDKALNDVFDSLFYMFESDYKRGNYMQAAIYFEILQKTNLEISGEMNVMASTCYMRLYQSEGAYEELKKRALYYAKKAVKQESFAAKTILKRIKKM